MSLNRVELRPARSEEVQQLAAFQVAMAAETETLDLDLPTVLRGINHVLDHPAEGLYYAILVHDELVGCAMTLYEWSEWRARRVLWLHSLYIKQEFRGQGLFREFYSFLQKRVESDPGLAGIRLYVDRGNIAAQKVYAQLGMNAEHYQLYEWLRPADQ